ncbi:MAG: antibiotic biosynthesis monooxygenase family protein [Chloroherpetonaceae bacterium]|nr:antibiotic biosynthesis monooxygenase family protein [Chloroherpetonaceae bacterium]
MIVRMVRMTFKPEEVSRFLALYTSIAPKIKAVEGCHSVGLYHDVDAEFTYATISAWESKEALESYRQSDFFKETWAKVKMMQSSKAVAHSYEIHPLQNS